MSARLMQILANLAKKEPLSELLADCEYQPLISTAKLERKLSKAGAKLGDYAYYLRKEFDAQAAELAEARELLREARHFCQQAPSVLPRIDAFLEKGQ